MVYKLRPKPGLCVIFEHTILHEGAPVPQGHKYLLRTDVVFQRYIPPTMASHFPTNSETPISNQESKTPRRATRRTARIRSTAEWCSTTRYVSLQTKARDSRWNT